MGAQGVEETFVLQVRDIKFPGSALYNICNVRIMRVAYFWEKVVFHLKIQSADIPGQEPVVA